MRILIWALGMSVAAMLSLTSCQAVPAKFPVQSPTQSGQAINATSSDGIISYGETFGSDLSGDKPLILLFHQGGSNARGEYVQIARWLQDAGFATLAWDTRSGGQLYGSYNRTMVATGEHDPRAYCDAYPDLQAALNYVEGLNRKGPTIVWGSSFSGALVFQLAARNTQLVDGVVAFSAAAGEPLQDCLAKDWADRVQAPMLALRTAAEMDSPSGQAQKDGLEDAGASYLIVQNGIHGSSMLLDTRTDHDMSVTRDDVLDWLISIARP